MSHASVVTAPVSGTHMVMFGYSEFGHKLLYEVGSGNKPLGRQCVRACVCVCVCVCDVISEPVILVGIYTKSFFRKKVRAD